MGWLGDILGKSEEGAAILEKAEPPPRGAKRPTSWTFNPEDLGYSLNGLAEVAMSTHPGTLGMDYHTLMAVSRVPVIGAIIQTRIQQVAEFAREQSDRFSPGFKIKQRDPKARGSRAKDKMMREITDMIMSAGGIYGIGGFEPTIRAMMRDSLTYDQCNFEVLRKRGGQIYGFVPVDASTIRKAKITESEQKRGQRDPRSAAYVQVVNNKVVNQYPADQMAWGIRRPRTWIEVSGYGYPELEELTRVITDLLNASTWNSVNFTNGIHTNTILSVRSTMNAEVFNAFQRHVTSMMSGVRNAKRVPIIQLNPEANEDIKPISLNASPKDAEFMSWMGYLIKIVCAVYLMDPAELGFVFGSEGQANSLVAQGPTERIVASKERGLRPLLGSLEHWLNEYVIYPYNSDFKLEFVGLNSLGEKDRSQIDAQTIRHFKTINEVRAEYDLEPLDTDVANMILDPTYISTVNAANMQKEMAEQQQQQGGMGMDGGFGMGGGFGEDPSPDWGSDQGFDAGFDMDGATQAMAMATERAIEDGKFIMKSDRTSKAKKVLVPRRDGETSFIVEVT